MSIRLNDEIIEPEEFKERVDNFSSFRHYPVNNEQDLTIYYNQPIDKYKIGLIDLKDESILDCNMKIADENLVLLFKDRPIVRIKNWSVYPSVREIMFTFNDTKIFNMKCIVSNCNLEEIIEESRKEKIKFSKKNSVADNSIWDIPSQEEKENEESTQRHERHRIRHEGHHRRHRNRRNIKNDNFAIESNKATSGASKQFSWVNAFANTVVSAAGGVISFF
ncbi:MAG: hypothetical protein ACR5KV_06890 [Wolbachia sp.]